MSNRPDPEITFRPALRDDTPAMVALFLQGDAVRPLSPEHAAAEADHPDYLTAFDTVAASPDVEMFVAERDGAVIGTIKVVLVPGLAGRGRTRARFESVHVAPDLRGKGVGAAMIAFAEDIARGRGATSVELTSNANREDAHRFYRRLGFDQSHAGFRKTL
jgi:GNAT superfamily N-acetyltransferase